MKKTFVVKFAIAALLALGSFTQAQDTAIPAVDSLAPEAVQADNQPSVSDNVSVQGEVEMVAPVAPESVVYDSAMTTGSDCVGCGQAVPQMLGNVVAAPLTTGCTGCTSGCGTVQTATFAPTTSCGGCNQVSQVAYQQPVANCGCNQVAQVAYQQPTTSCGCNNQVAQVAYDQPLYQQPTVSSVPTTLASTPTSVVTSPIVNPAPAPAMYTPTTSYPSPVYTPVTSGCSSCGTTATPMVSTNYATSSVGTSYFNSGYTSTGCNNCGTQTQTRGRLRGRIFRNR